MNTSKIVTKNLEPEKLKPNESPKKMGKIKVLVSVFH